MSINYLGISIVLIAILILLIWMIRRNSRDRKDFEQQSKDADIGPRLHKEDEL